MLNQGCIWSLMSDHPFYKSLIKCVLVLWYSHKTDKCRSKWPHTSYLSADRFTWQRAKNWLTHILRN